MGEGSRVINTKKFMHFPKHWFSAKRGEVSAWGWSDESLAHAEAHAESRLVRILEWLRRGDDRQLQRYGYPGRPMREEVLKEFHGTDGTLNAAVTRNSYGCLVLNTSQLMFVDIDAPRAKESSFLAGLFGFRKPDKNKSENGFEKNTLAQVHRWLDVHPDWGWRVYRTRAGIRLMATHQSIASDNALTSEAFELFSSDPLYRQLCASQKCFRARLTPKPWRCGSDKPRHRWPWKDAKAEATFRAWEKKYLSVSSRHATCQLIGHFGNSSPHSALSELIQFHDQATRAEKTGLPLA